MDPWLACPDGAKSGFNSFLNGEEGADVYLSLTLFDHEYTPVIQSVPLESVPNLDDTLTAEPRGTTALLDAVGRSIHDFKQGLIKNPKANSSNDGVVVLTDGLENASKDYDYKRVKDLIDQQKAGVGVPLLASDLESSEDAENFGFQAVEQHSQISYGKHGICRR